MYQGESLISEIPGHSRVVDSTERVSPSNALSPSFEDHRECLQSLLFLKPELVVRTLRVNAEHVPKPAARPRAKADAKRHHVTKLDATSTQTGSTES